MPHDPPRQHISALSVCSSDMQEGGPHIIDNIIVELLTLSFSSMSAPRWIKSSKHDAWPNRAAHIMAVLFD